MSNIKALKIVRAGGVVGGFLQHRLDVAALDQAQLKDVAKLVQSLAAWKPTPAESRPVDKFDYMIHVTTDAGESALHIQGAGAEAAVKALWAMTKPADRS